jgi:phytoene synthase
LGQVFILVEILQAHGAKREDLAVGHASPGVLAALAGLRAVARAHLDIFYATLPRSCPPLFASLICA